MVVWLVHARVGHRQGLYPRRPPHPGRPSSLSATGHRNAQHSAMPPLRHLARPRLRRTTTSTAWGRTRTAVLVDSLNVSSSVRLRKARKSEQAKHSRLRFPWPQPASLGGLQAFAPVASSNGWALATYETRPGDRHSYETSKAEGLQVEAFALSGTCAAGSTSDKTHLSQRRSRRFRSGYCFLPPWAESEPDGRGSRPKLMVVIFLSKAFTTSGVRSLVMFPARTTSRLSSKPH